MLVVVDHLSMELLVREAAIAASWTEAGHPPLLTMTTDEWRGSADVFPIEYADLLEAHRVIHGALPLEGVAVEQGRPAPAISSTRRWGSSCACGAGSWRRAASPKRQLALLAESVRAFVVLFRALLRVHGDAPAGGGGGGRAPRRRVRAGFDAESFTRRCSTRAAREKIPRRRRGACWPPILPGATQLAHHIDRMGVT